jgi:hypothetical protein
MPTIINADQLRGVLGVSENLFDDNYLDQIIDTAEGAIVPLLKELPEGDEYADVPVVVSTIIAASVEVFQSRVAPGGSQEGVDFSPAPFKLGRSFFNRYTGLLGDYIDVETMAQ